MAYIASRREFVYFTDWHQVSGGEPMSSDPDEWTGVVEKTGKRITVRRDFDGCLQGCKQSEVYKGWR